MQKLAIKFHRKFKKLRKCKTSNLNIFLVCLAVIMIWRWIRNLLDLYIFPNCQRLSCIICLVLWILILIADDGKIDELN